jgi:hypothetical protein
MVVVEADGLPGAIHEEHEQDRIALDRAAGLIELDLDIAR